MPKRVIVMNFETNATAYQAFSELKKLQIQKELNGEQMAIVTHTNTGSHQFEIEDFIDFTGTNKASTGGLIGMLVGILGGPLGILLGWFGGSLIGASRDAKEIQTAQSLFEFLADQIGTGATGLILIAYEEDNRPLNRVVLNELGGDITRFDFYEVEEEIKKATEVEETTRMKAKADWADKHRDKHDSKEN